MCEIAKEEDMLSAFRLLVADMSEPRSEWFSFEVVLELNGNYRQNGKNNHEYK